MRERGWPRFAARTSVAQFAAGRGVTRFAAGASIALLAACANIAPPPGGPPDAVPPSLIAVLPEQLAVIPDFSEDVEFRFDEVISEGSVPNQGLGTGDLEKLVLLSPTTEVPKVSWRRRRIAVKPAEGWQPNRIYRVELLPGVTDVRRNRSTARAVVTFSTGAPPPTDTLRGTVIDWQTNRPAARALVVAILQPDSLPYRMLADSSGRFEFGPLPSGEYVLYGVLDQNQDFRMDPREAFDSIRVASDTIERAELYAFVHDSLPPRIATVTATDSVTATVTFAQALDPFQRLDSSAATLRQLPDSTVVPVAAVLRGAAAGPATDTLRAADTLPGADTLGPARPDTARADTLVAPLDTGARRADTAGVVSRRPPLSDRLVVKATEPWRPGDRFVLEIRGVRTVSGVTGDVRAVFTIGKPQGPPGVPADKRPPGWPPGQPLPGRPGDTLPRVPTDTLPGAPANLPPPPQAPPTDSPPRATRSDA